MYVKLQAHGFVCYLYHLLQVIIPKAKGETLGVVIVDSGWGSVLPTAVLANMHPSGPAARCGQLNIGNRIISINGQSLVGLPLATCQSLFKVSDLLLCCLFLFGPLPIPPYELTRLAKIYAP